MNDRHWREAAVAGPAIYGASCQRQRAFSQVVAFQGDRAGDLTGALFRDAVDGTEKICPMRHLFLFIGADPHTGWLQGCVALDDKGFVPTGGRKESAARQPYPLETSRPGIFAVGDVRAGSTKRVAAAVGKGAASGRPDSRDAGVLTVCVGPVPLLNQPGGTAGRPVAHRCRRRG